MERMIGLSWRELRIGVAPRVREAKKRTGRESIELAPPATADCHWKLKTLEARSQPASQPARGERAPLQRAGTHERHDKWARAPAHQLAAPSAPSALERAHLTLE